jgi:hypothetical protein
MKTGGVAEEGDGVYKGLVRGGGRRKEERIGEALRRGRR